MRLHLLTTVSIGLLAAACQAPYQQRASAPMPLPASTAGYSSEQACSEYGFNRGSMEFDRCVSRERSARQMGRVNRDYAEARLNVDARDACTSYGLEPGSMRYNACVNREVDARVYREEVRTGPGYQGTTTVYQNGPVYQNAPAYRVTQDGTRVDSAGYRVDAYGNRM